MSDISKFKVGNDTYNIKDEESRNTMAETVLSTDTIPFVSKIMGAGKYQRKKFVGCSFVWNQLVDVSYKKDTINFNSSTGVYSFTLTPNTYTVYLYDSYPFMHISGHKYLYIYTCISNINSSFRFYGEVSGYDLMSFRLSTQSKSFIHNATVTEGCNIASYGEINVERSAEFKFICIDLTQLFGSTAIADYIYNLEQVTAGAGIAKLKELGFFTEDYYAYDAGSIQSVDIKEYSVTGFNLWDEQWKVSNVPFSGANLQSKNIIKVFPNATYFIQNSTVNIGSRGINIAYYDSNDNVISTDRIYTTSVTIPNNCYGIKFGFATNYYGTTYNNDICINLSDPTRNGQYEPYHKTTYSLTPTELRGVPRIDANNNIYCDGDEYASDGGHTEKYGIVDLGEYNWELLSSGIFRTTTGMPNAVTKYALARMISNKYVTVQYSEVNNIDKSMVMIPTGYGNAGRITIHDSAYSTSTVEDFKTAMSGVYLVYEKATPTTETLTPFDYPQSVGSLEEITDYKVEQEQRDVAIPTGHVTEYMGKGGEFTLPTLPQTPSVLAFDGHNFFWKPETT